MQARNHAQVIEGDIAGRPPPVAGHGRISARLIRSYGLAVIWLAIALGLGLLGQAHGLNRVQTPLFMMAIMVTVWYGGAVPGAFAVVVSSIAFAFFFSEPKYSFEIHADDQPQFAAFVLFALTVGWFASSRRRNEQDLRRARDQLAAEVAVRTEQASLLDLTHDSIFVRDMNDIITYWNHGAEELFGWNAEQALGRSAHDLLRTVFPTSLDDVHAELLRTGHWEGELGKTRADGTSLVVFARWALRRDEQQQPVSVLASNNDITERRRREEEIRRLNLDLAKRTAELEASNKELEAFAYSTSHDLRAPLRHMAGYSELLQKHAASMLDEEGRYYVTKLQAGARRMGRLIDDLLAFSRIGRTETQSALVSLERLVREVVVDLERETEGRDIEWKIGPLPSLHGDRAMLKVVLFNLVSNAVKFTRTRARAEIEIAAMDGKPGEVVVFVRDNGVGFDMRYVGKLFGVFQRLHRKEAFEGTGIGLATVQRIVARHGGRVWADSVLGGGATFYIAAPKP